MKKIILSVFAVFALSFSGLSQDVGAKAFTIISDCSCREIIMNSRGIEKSYSANWIESAKLEDGFIVFSKGDHIHRWNAEKITFIEKGNGFIKIFMD